ncbi:MAG TPA: hypothetical protein VG756_07550 [Pseudonocardiaceae bacterium]|nr:hypothetical protein [Pseudonocardiaceae bacterium]
MSGWGRRLLGRLGGDDLPKDFPGKLTAEERVLAVGREREGGALVATSLGLWLPDGAGSRRVGWHLISKATWDNGTLAVIESEETGTVDGAVLLADRPVRRFRLAGRGTLPESVHARVTGSIKSSHRRELPGGGVWVVQRKVAGRDGIVVQVRADPGTSQDAVRSLTAQMMVKINRVRAAE